MSDLQEMITIVSGNKTDLNVRILKTLEENGIGSKSYKKCRKKKYRHASLTML